MSDEQSGKSPPPQPDSDELLRLFFDSVTEYAILTMDLDGLTTTWNLGAERLLGYSAGEILGRSCDVIFTTEDQAQGVPDLERARALQDASTEDERWHQRKDGSQFWGSGLLMCLSDGSGFVKIFRDLTGRYEVAERLRESEKLFRVLTTNIPQLVFRSRASGHRTWGSPQWETFTGLLDTQSRGFGWLDAIHADDRALTHEAWSEAQETGTYYVEHRILRASDGEWRWHQTRAQPMEDFGKEFVEWVGTSTDIHELRGFQDRQKVLLAELQHRTRNLLAVVQSIGRQTIRTSPGLEEFTIEFESRLRALSRVQGLLARADQSIHLREIVDAELAAHAYEGIASSHMQVDGPPVQLSASGAQALALALHELTTNAVKYGALGQPGGVLRVDWRLDAGSDGTQAVLVNWRESHVTMPTDVPRRRGYGSELIERALPYQLQAQTSLAFGPDGVECSIRVPIQRGSDKSR